MKTSVDRGLCCPVLCCKPRVSQRRTRPVPRPGHALLGPAACGTHSGFPSPATSSSPGDCLGPPHIGLSSLPPVGPFLGASLLPPELGGLVLGAGPLPSTFCNLGALVGLTQQTLLSIDGVHGPRTKWEKLGRPRCSFFRGIRGALVPGMVASESRASYSQSEAYSAVDSGQRWREAGLGRDPRSGCREWQWGYPEG